jgi:PAS domain-containing protein
MEGTDESPFISMVERNATGEFVLDNNNYLYKKLQLSNETMFQIEDGECPWYIVGHYNMALLAKDKQFILRNILPISVILCIIGILISYTIMILLQVKANDNLLLMVSSYISDSSQDGIIILNSRKVIVYCNQVFEEIYSYKKIEF